MEVYKSTHTSEAFNFALSAVPSIGENGNWFIGEQDTGIFAKGINVTGAEVGQTVKVAAVDENGVPTAWEPGDLNEWRLIKSITLEEAARSIDWFSTDEDGKEFDLRGVRLISRNIASSVYVSNDMHGRLGVATRTGNSNDSVFANNAFIEIAMVQNPSNYPFFAQVLNCGGIWRVETSNGYSGMRGNFCQNAKSETIQKLMLGVNNPNNFVYAAGTTFEFWGIDA